MNIPESSRADGFKFSATEAGSEKPADVSVPDNAVHSHEWMASHAVQSGLSLQTNTHTIHGRLAGTDSITASGVPVPPSVAGEYPHYGDVGAGWRL